MNHPAIRRITGIALACALGVMGVIGVVTPSALAAPRAVAKADPEPVTVFRFYNRITGVHFYTADAAERSLVLAS